QDAAGGIAPTGISISPSVIDVPDNQSVPFVLTIFVDSSVTPGTYNLRIRTYDTSNTIEKFVYITLNVTSGQVIPDPSFSITTGTNNLTIEQGGSQSVSMTITPTNGFTGAVNFELQDAAGGIAPTGISISPSVIDVPDNQSVPFTLTVFVDSSVTPGTYTLRIRAYDSSNTIEKFIYITLNVTGGFDITIETYDFTLNTNSATTTHLTITPHSGFTGTINLELQDVSTGLPSNDITISPTQVIVEDLNPISLLITLSVSSTANVGVHNLRIEASSGNIKRYLYINIVVQ
ncbi:COG1361 family protein, partial [Thermosipho atlanticus]